MSTSYKFTYLFIAFCILVIDTEPANSQPCPLDLDIDVDGYFPLYDDYKFKVKIYYLYTPEFNPWENFDIEQSAHNILEHLNAVFNEHEIYFYGPEVGCDAPELANLYLMLSLDDDSIRNDTTLTDNKYINILIHSPNVEMPLGTPFNIPNYFLSIYGSASDGKIAAETPALIHEMGHLFGLMHTHESSCNETCIEACKCTGDYVCDTPNNPSVTVPCSTGLGKNYMSYNNLEDSHYCRNHFTPDQGFRMQAYAGSAAILQTARLFPTVINASTDTLGGIYGDLIIKSGTYYVLDYPLYMANGTRITIEKGAVFDIRSQITSACGKLWKGIYVEGSSFQGQNPTSQGQVILRGQNASIEDARCAIETYGGGIVKIWGGTLKNNARGIKFAQYGAFTSVSVRFAKFTTTDEYLFPIADELTYEAQPRYIILDASRGIKIQNTLFIDERTDCGYFLPPIGIDARIGYFKVVSCHFKHMDSGIKLINNNGSPGTLDILNNMFERCERGIFVHKSNTFNISNNIFDLTAPLTCPNSLITGIRIHGGDTYDFIIEDNLFYNSLLKNQPDTLLGYTTTGIYCRNLGEHNNFIRGNSFEYLHVANQVRGENADDQVPSRGLKFLCNDFLSLVRDTTIDFSGYAIHLNSDARIANPQAEKITIGDSILYLPTGNSFNDISGEVLYNENSSFPTDYYYSLITENEIPPGVEFTNFNAIPLFLENYYCPGNHSIVVRQEEDKTEQLDKIEINVYPNPTSDYWVLDCEHCPNATLEVINTQGKIAYWQEIQSGIQKIDAQQLPSGLYFLNIISKKTFRSIKVIKY